MIKLNLKNIGIFGFLVISVNAVAALPSLPMDAPATELIKTGMLKDCSAVTACLDGERFALNQANQTITNKKGYILQLAENWNSTLTYRFNYASGSNSILNTAVQGSRRLKENLKIWSQLDAIRKNPVAQEKITFSKSDKSNTKLFSILLDLGIISPTANSVSISFAELFDHLHSKPIPTQYYTNDTLIWNDGKKNFSQIYTKVIERRCPGVDNSSNWFMGNNRDFEESHACGLAGIMFPRAIGSASRVIALAIDVKNALGLYDGRYEVARVAGFDMRNPESPRYQNESFSLASSGYAVLSRMTSEDIISKIDEFNSLSLLGTVRSLLFMRSGPVRLNQGKAVSTYVQSHGDTSHLSLLSDLVDMFGLLPYKYKTTHIDALARVWLAEGRPRWELQTLIDNKLSANEVLLVPSAESVNFTKSSELDASWVNDAGLGVMRRGTYESADGITLMYKGTGSELTHWHEDQGTFEMYAFGAPIALNTDAYGYDAIYRQLDINDLLKASRYKNGISFEDSHGFHIYGLQGSSGRQAHVRVAKSTQTIDYALIDTSAAYFASQSANRFGRKEAFIKNKTMLSRAIMLNKEVGYVVIVDSIKNLPRATDSSLSPERLINTISSNFQIPGNRISPPKASINSPSRSIQLTEVGDKCVGVQILNPHSDGSVKLDQQLASDTLKTGDAKSIDPNWGLNFVPGTNDQTEWQRAHITQRASIANAAPSDKISIRIVTILYPNKIKNCTLPEKQLSSADIVTNDLEGIQIKINFDGKSDYILFNENSGIVYTSSKTGNRTALTHYYDRPRTDIKVQIEAGGTMLISNTSKKTITDPIFVLGAQSSEPLRNNIIVNPEGPNFPSYTVGAMVTASPLRAGGKIRVNLYQSDSSVIGASGRNF
jgi:hypothetical protein